MAAHTAQANRKITPDESWHGGSAAEHANRGTTGPATAMAAAPTATAIAPSSTVGAVVLRLAAIDIAYVPGHDATQASGSSKLAGSAVATMAATQGL